MPAAGSGSAGWWWGAWAQGWWSAAAWIGARSPTSRSSRRSAPRIPRRSEPSPAIAFRRLADALDGDREALVAQASSIYRGEIALERISAPTLVLAGDTDPLALRPEVLVAAIPDADAADRSHGDHTHAVVDPRFASSIVDFLA